MTAWKDIKTDGDLLHCLNTTPFPELDYKATFVKKGLGYDVKVNMEGRGTGSGMYRTLSGLITSDYKLVSFQTLGINFQLPY